MSVCDRADCLSCIRRVAGREGVAAYRARVQRGRETGKSASYIRRLRQSFALVSREGQDAAVISLDGPTATAAAMDDVSDVDTVASGATDAYLDTDEEDSFSFSDFGSFDGFGFYHNYDRRPSLRVVGPAHVHRKRRVPGGQRKREAAMPDDYHRFNMNRFGPSKASRSLRSVPIYQRRGRPMLAHLAPVVVSDAAERVVAHPLHFDDPWAHLAW